MKFPRMTRRRFIGLALITVPACCVGEGFLLEPEWLVVRNLGLGGEKPTHRIVHFTDLHYKGDQAYLTSVIDKINDLSPDFVCFTGDIVEDRRFLKEALGILKGIRSPMFGVPGNHEYWSGASFPRIAGCFEATGGAWLVDEGTTIADGGLSIFGSAGKDADRIQESTAAKRLLLTHYPAFVDELNGTTFDLILAGHSHGGQVRIPLWGALTVPFGVGRYDRGLYQTAAGPLYVNPGIGWWRVPARFCCRPEITVIEF